jgi:flagellar biosynthesis/type III secretory pathway ATPase
MADVGLARLMAQCLTGASRGRSSNVAMSRTVGISKPPQLLMQNNEEAETTAGASVFPLPSTIKDVTETPTGNRRIGDAGDAIGDADVSKSISRPVHDATTKHRKNQHRSLTYQCKKQQQQYENVQQTRKMGSPDLLHR